jgi:hypothetical protein
MLRPHIGGVVLSGLCCAELHGMCGEVPCGVVLRRAVSAVPSPSVRCIIPHGAAKWAVKCNVQCGVRGAERGWLQNACS